MTSRFGRLCANLVPFAACAFVLSVAPAAASPGAAAGARDAEAPGGSIPRYVIHVSVDGLRGDAVPRLGPANVPHFYRMIVEGASTDNARTDFDYTITLPNHACQLTSRPVLGAEGHGLSYNSDDGRTLELIHGSYVAGVFDVAHDNGLGTALYTSKSKFALFDRSWNESNGAPDATGDDDGRDKIDTYLYSAATEALIDSFVAHSTAAPARYSFIHLVDPDAVGHSAGWESGAYFDSVIKVDGLIGRIFDLATHNPLLEGKTWIVVTADHGGIAKDHSNALLAANYTVPMFVWGPGVPPGTDLYYLSAATRLDPNSGSPPYSVTPQPIRNGEAANLALYLLGLGAVPGSSITAEQDNDPLPPAGAAPPPRVALPRPQSGAALEHPASVTIEAMAETEGGAIQYVEFFANYVKLGESSAVPYSFEWSGMAPGPYRITARAVRDDGIGAVASVDIEVVSTADVPEGHSSLPLPPRL